jgi:hypothetical protein
MAGDTAADTASAEMAGASVDTVAVGDSANIGKTGERLEPTESSQQANADTLAGQSESERVRPPEDSSEVLGSVTTSDSVASSDTSVTPSTEMARDTSTGVAQVDTSVQVQVDTGTQVADTGSVTPADTGVAVQAQMDTTTADQQTEVAVQAPDTSIVVGDPIRPPEDSTEMLGNVTTEEDRAKNEAEPAGDQAPAAAAGAQASGGMVTGAAAVAQVTREGRRCAVVQSGESEGDSEEDIRWDLAGSPATMNPCGTGTMTLPRIQTEK